MTITTEGLASYLGRKVSVLLSDPPFRHWKFERSVETDLADPLVDYVFGDDGVDVVCDGDDRVDSIFLYADESRRFREGVRDLPFTLNRQEVRGLLGAPSRSGMGMVDPLLGRSGGWDRFARSGFSIHIEYNRDASAVRKITLMRAGVVPS